MDVLWFRLSRKQNDTTDTFGHIEAGRMMIMLDRGDYWQCAYVIPKGGIEISRRRGSMLSEAGHGHVPVSRRSHRVN